MGAQMKRQEKSKENYNLDQQLGLEWVFYLAMESRSNRDKHKYTTKRKHNDHHISKEEKGGRGEKQNKNSPDDAEQGYVDPTAQT